MKQVHSTELAASIEKMLPRGIVRLNECSQEFLWVQKTTVQLLLLRQDDFFGWIPLEFESLIYQPEQEWWQPMWFHRPLAIKL